MTTRSLALALASVALLAGCPAPVRPPPESQPLESLPPPALAGATVYEVSAADSRVHVLVFRGGALANLGHNHVMTSKSLSGQVWVHPELSRSGFELAFPVAELIVDDPAARAAAGSEFASQLSPSDKEGTRRNMLRPEVLDAERYPTVGLRSVAVSGSPAAPLVRTRITLKGTSREVDVPASVEVDGARLTATGEFAIQQSAFGIEPFSVALGALTVQDRLVIRFEVVADETQGGT